VWESFEDLKNVNVEGRTIFKPQISEEKASKQFERWEKAVQMSKGWVN
jgi:glycerol kinase